MKPPDPVLRETEPDYEPEPIPVTVPFPNGVDKDVRTVISMDAVDAAIEEAGLSRKKTEAQMVEAEIVTGEKKRTNHSLRGEGPPDETGMTPYREYRYNRWAEQKNRLSHIGAMERREQCFYYRVHERWTIARIAKHLKCCEKTVKSHVKAETERLHNRMSSADEVASVKLRIAEVIESVIERGIDGMRGYWLDDTTGNLISDSSAPAFAALALKASEQLGDLYGVKDLKPKEMEAATVDEKLAERMIELSPNLAKHSEALRAIETQMDRKKLPDVDPKPMPDDKLT